MRWLKINRNIQFFLKIVFHPHIVVPNKKMNLYSFVGNFRELAQQSDISLRYHLPVLIPKVKNISNDENLGSILLYFVQKLNDELLSLKTAFIVWSAKVKIGEKINFFIIGQFHLVYSFPEDI